MNILGIESSCDETSAAVMRDGVVLSNVISSQEVHAQYGGVVPELASRAHLEMIIPVVEKSLSAANVTLQDVNVIGVTSEPGLLGSLLVGENFAKTLALSLDVPVYPINHLEGHMFSGFLENRDIAFPFIALVVSGGHTMLVLVKDVNDYTLLGTTQDDAAGEAFDKVAKILGLGYPGGPAVDKLAKQGNPKAAHFPRPLYYEDDFMFSFSGMKTFALNLARKADAPHVNDICASFQRAVIDVLAMKTMRAAEEFGVKDVVVAGGVSANSELRATMQEDCTKRRMRLTIPRLAYCTDNAAMIANLTEFKIKSGVTPPATIAASARSTLLPFSV
ncbi:MAG TPA: tRNA (adenosine(37)-N6)-threonylcarbamoyltransferase complex transferase subunit TsaD [Candidatus Kapabacteria bacterium]|nr:tRNA (adenosine(37)-N6)-threonylcarbamoyltransferase complex transferase subunit TsaD [Candidatus Kapabacteria bacterium]